MAGYLAHHGRLWCSPPPYSSSRSSTASNPWRKTNPELTAQLQSLAHSAGLQIPESRIFLMHASDKVTTYNAYVTGFGATKRIVVWDTTARDLTLPQTLFVFGHEMGHYVLHHIYLGLAFSALLMFAALWLIQRLAQAALARYGEALANPFPRRLVFAPSVTVAGFSSFVFRRTAGQHLQPMGRAPGGCVRIGGHTTDNERRWPDCRSSLPIAWRKIVFLSEPLAFSRLLELFAPANFAANPLYPLESICW